MRNLWNSKEAKLFSKSKLQHRVYSSRLLGRDHELVLHGGGNTSVKGQYKTIFGDKIEMFGFKSTIKGNSIKEEVYKVMPRITPTSRNIDLQYDRATSVSIPLNSEQYSLLKQKAGENFTKNMGKLMFKSYYQNEDKLIVKEAMQKNALSAARSEARAFIKNTYKEELLAKGEEIALRKQLDRQKGEEPGAGEIQSALDKLLQNKEETK